MRKHIYFSGRVQGVGFRYRARCAADGLGLTGWVRNLWDDRVEMEVQGEEKAIPKMVEQLEHGTFIQITEIEMDDRPLEEHESSFRVVGY